MSGLWTEDERRTQEKGVFEGWLSTHYPEIANAIRQRDASMTAGRSDARKYSNAVKMYRLLRHAWMSRAGMRI